MQMNVTLREWYRPTFVSGSTRYPSSSFEMLGFFEVKGVGSDFLSLSADALEKDINKIAKTINAFKIRLFFRIGYDLTILLVLPVK
jgi:hypothetical protein